VLELRPVRAAVVRCFGQAKALDGFPSLGAAAARVAADELWLLCPRGGETDLARGATSYLSGADPDGLVLEHGEGWAVWSLSGAGARDAFARLADFPLPREDRGGVFAQGAFAQVPAKVLVSRDLLQVIVPVQLAHHIPDRVREACPDLQPTLGEARDWPPSEATA
jgi:hypothetical protein